MMPRATQPRTADGAMTGATLIAALCLAVFCLASLCLAACTIPAGERGDDGDSRATQGAGPQPTLADSQGDPHAQPQAPGGGAMEVGALDDGVLESIVAAVTAEFGGRAGVAVFDGVQVHSAGTTEGFPAWSTAKVPVAIAASRAGVADQVTLNQAIVYSDNAAAEALWGALGAPERAGHQTQQVLADAGDTATQVQTVRVREGFTPFGQTVWPLERQAQFAYHLPALAGAEAVDAAMAQPDPAQMYGLRTVDGARLKGGWGPDPSGAYDVMQMGRIDVGGRTVGVAIYAQAGDGSYATAQQALSALTTRLVQ